MGRSSRKRTGKKLSSGRSTTQIVPSSLSSVPSPARPRFHIDWKQVNFVQFLGVFPCFLFLTLFIVIPILNEYHLLRPHANALAQILSAAFLALATILSTGLIYVQKVTIWQRLKSKQILSDVAISTLAMVVMLASIVQFPILLPSSHPNLSRIPYPPYQQGTLIVDGMSSKPSSNYYWVQRSDGQRSCKFVGSSYDVTSTKQDNLELCELANADFHDFAFEIDMSFLKPGTASIFFQSTDQSSYQLNIKSLGNYAELSFGVLSGFKEHKLSFRELIQLMPIVARDGGPVAFSSGYTNRIAIVEISQSISLYVNGLTAQNWQRTDDSSSHGSLAVAAYTPLDQQDTQTEVVFSHARLWTL